MTIESRNRRIMATFQSKHYFGCVFYNSFHEINSCSNHLTIQSNNHWYYWYQKHMKVTKLIWLCIHFSFANYFKTEFSPFEIKQGCQGHNQCERIFGHFNPLPLVDRHDPPFYGVKLPKLQELWAGHGWIHGSSLL